jgi:hypothetical protein
MASKSAPFVRMHLIRSLSAPEMAPLWGLTNGLGQRIARRKSERVDDVD